MNTTHASRKAFTATLSALVAGAAASALLSLGAGISHAGEFDPQPDPPGQARGFDPQPEPRTRHIKVLNPQIGLKHVSIGH